MINDCPDGGLKMIDIESFNKSLNKNHLDKKISRSKQSREMESFL